MSTLVLAEFPSEEKLARMNESQLIGLLDNCLRLTAESLKRAAQVVKLLDSKGADLSELNQTMLGYMRKIGAGQLHPDLLVTWRETPVYNRARLLPMPVQEAVISNKPIKVAVIKDNGEFNATLMEPRAMTPAIAKQALAPDHIRTYEEQIAYLRSAQNVAAVKATKPEPMPYSIVGKAVVFNRPCRLTIKDLKNLVKQLT